MDTETIQRLLASAAGRAELRSWIASELADSAIGRTDVDRLRCLRGLVADVEREELARARLERMYG